LAYRREDYSQESSPNDPTAEFWQYPAGFSVGVYQADGRIRAISPKRRKLNMNPVSAFKGTKCDNCGENVEAGDDLYLTDDGKMCRPCADENDYVCDCGNFKKPGFNRCYECAISD
jgi:hypothetical protein